MCASQQVPCSTAPTVMLWFLGAVVYMCCNWIAAGKWWHLRCSSQNINGLHRMNSDTLATSDLSGIKIPQGVRVISLQQSICCSGCSLCVRVERGASVPYASGGNLSSPTCM